MDLSAPLLIFQVLHTRPSWGDFTLKFGRVRVLYLSHAYSSCCLFPDPLFSKIRYVAITQGWHNSCHLRASEMVQVPQIFIPGFQMCVLSHVTCLSQDHIFAHKIRWGSIWIEGPVWKSHRLLLIMQPSSAAFLSMNKSLFCLWGLRLSQEYFTRTQPSLNPAPVNFHLLTPIN